MVDKIVQANGVDLCVDTFGDPADPAILLISGSGAPMDWWEPEFCQRLADGWRFVIRYDHRDTGRSVSYEPGAPPYSFGDLVADAVGVLDAFGLARAHLVGISMGGAIGQLVAIEQPDRVESLTLIATSPWRDQLGTIQARTLVLHGTEDPLFPYEHGVALASEIPEARLIPLEQTGHELPRAIWPTAVPAILRHTSGGWPQQANLLAAKSLASGDPTGWFAQLYASAEAGEVAVPWDWGQPNPLLVEWAQAKDRAGKGNRALVVGCGLGENAEYIAGLGYDTTAFDIADTAIRIVRGRFPDSPVRYLTADLLDPPAQWLQAFDLVVEVYTIQALPDPPRRRAIAKVARLVALGGALIVVAVARGEHDDPDPGPPWPLTRAEINAFATGGLTPVAVEDLQDQDNPRVRHWRAEFRRPVRAQRPG